MGQAKRRGTYEDRVKQALNSIPPAKTINKTNWKAINTDTKLDSILDVLHAMYDEDPRLCETLVLGTVSQMQKNYKFLRESALKNITSHSQAITVTDLNGNVISNLADFFIDVRKITPKQQQYITAQYQKDYYSGVRVLKPGVMINDDLGIQTVFSYMTEIDGVPISMIILNIRTPGGVSKNQISFFEESQAHYQGWKSITVKETAQ